MIFLEFNYVSAIFSNLLDNARVILTIIRIDGFTSKTRLKHFRIWFRFQFCVGRIDCDNISVTNNLNIDVLFIIVNASDNTVIPLQFLFIEDFTESVLVLVLNGFCVEEEILILLLTLDFQFLLLDGTL